MPLPQTMVFHPEWNAHHRPTATSAMTGTCVITRAAATGPAPTTSADGTWTPGVRTTIYTGPCRVVVTGEKRAVSGERRTTLGGYRIGIEHDTAEILIGDIVELTGASDAGLVGRKLRVSGVEYGSEQWQRDLSAEEILRGAT